MLETFINIIMDESGSMHTKIDDVIGGFNKFLEDQQKLLDPCRMSLTKFNTICATVIHATPIGQVKPLSKETYTPGGNTALFDAIAQCVRIVDQERKPDERIVCIIVTDGEENSSRETTYEQVKEIISKREAQGDWTFVYLGVSPEQFSKEMGVASGNTMAYTGTRKDYATMSASTTAFRGSGMQASQNYIIPEQKKDNT